MYTSSAFNKCAARLTAWNAAGDTPQHDLIADHTSHASGW
jgi:hypothetical protein